MVNLPELATKVFYQSRLPRLFIRVGYQDFLSELATKGFLPELVTKVFYKVNRSFFKKTLLS